MRINRRCRTQRSQHVDLPWSVIQMIVTPHHMGDLHIPIIHHHTEVIGRRAIRTCNDQIIQLSILKNYAAMHLIIHHHRSIQRVFEANDKWHPFTNICAIAATSVITRILFGSHLAGTQLLQFFAGAVTSIGFFLDQPLINHLPVTIHTPGLVERPLISSHTKPPHTVQNDLGSLVR